MKINIKEVKITIIKDIGYYHPSTANWNYHTHLIIDSTGARMYKETFGGDARLRDRLEKEGYTVEVLSAGIGSCLKASYKDIKDLFDIEKYNGKNWGEGSLGY